MTAKTYTIPLRKSFQQAAPLKRTPKAVRAIKAYVQHHAKTETVKIGPRLNASLWARGITRPPHKVTVTVEVQDDVAKVELEGFSYEEAKKIVKKQEPQTLKDKIQDKLGAPGAEEEPKKDDSKKEEAAPAKKSDAPAKEKAPVKKDSPAPAKATPAKKDE